MNDRAQVPAKADPNNPFGSARMAIAGAAAAAEAAAARQVAEVQAAMLIARRFPRDQRAALDRIVDACTRPSLAQEATFQYARGGTDIAAPSIRLAEAIAQQWGNLECGVKELSRSGEYSEVEAYAVDLETGFRDSKIFQVRHWRDTRQGGHKLTDERDIYELIANMAARRKRACILTVIPGDVVDKAMDQIEVTLKSNIEITDATVKATLEAFEKYGVTREMIEKRLQRRFDVENLTPALYLNLRRIWQSIKDGMSGPEDWFEMAPAEADAKGGTAGAAARAAAEARARAEADAKAKAEAEAKAKAESDAKKDPKKKDKGAKGADKKEDPKPGGKPEGTPEIKAKLLAKFEECKDADTLATAADEGNLHAWAEGDMKAINAAYLARLSQIEG